MPPIKPKNFTENDVREVQDKARGSLKSANSLKSMSDTELIALISLVEQELQDRQSPEARRGHFPWRYLARTF